MAFAYFSPVRLKYLFDKCGSSLISIVCNKHTYSFIKVIPRIGTRRPFKSDERARESDVVDLNCPSYRARTLESRRTRSARSSFRDPISPAYIRAHQFPLSGPRRSPYTGNRRADMHAHWAYSCACKLARVCPLRCFLIVHFY